MTTQRKAALAAGAGTAPNTAFDSRHFTLARQSTAYWHSTAVQRQIVLAALLDDPKTTILLRHDYDILMPNIRIMELRDASFKFEKIFVDAINPYGTVYSRVALYFLVEMAGK